MKVLFVDIGGVLLSNGWERQARKEAAKKFNLDFAGMESRHSLNFDTYELGKLSLKQYLDRVVFYQKRPFTHNQFWTFMAVQSKPFPRMVQLVRGLKARHELKIVVVSNEARDLNLHRIRKFKLNQFVDFFVSSSIVHFRKPDEDMFRYALDMAQVPAGRVAYVEDRDMFVQIAEGFGIRGVHHTGYHSTRAKLAALGLSA